jgi:succinyl-diaminopimelate desuccinylase
VRLTVLSSREVFSEVEGLKNEMVEALKQLISVPAVAPENGGEGELAKAEKLIQLIASAGFSRVERYDAMDQRVPGGKRPNIVAYLEGEVETPRLWVVTHLDVVPADASTWKVTEPFMPISTRDRVYGRGSEDNGQAVVAALYAAKALAHLGRKPKRTFAVAFVSDEEQGSTYGIQHLIKLGLFNASDLVVVPDGGSGDGAFIEVAEKSLLWFKLQTTGRQVHASLPNRGLNAHRVGMQVALALDQKLHEKYSLKDSFYIVPESTFEPTKKERNVDAVNIVPGEDIVYFDCRILPDYEIDDVLATVAELTENYAKKTGATVKVEVIQKQAAPPMKNTDAPVVTLLKQALKEARGLNATVGGIGGGTCAAFFRKAGIPAAVWSTIDEVAHQPDEYAKIENLVEDAKVFALLALL